MKSIFAIVSLLYFHSLDTIALQQGVDGRFAASELTIEVGGRFGATALKDMLAEESRCLLVEDRAVLLLRCFEYRESRSGKWAKDFLEGFHGVLITDGYSGYNKVQDAEHAGCWAHMRRKWLDAMPKGADAKSCKAAQGYAFCNRLFELERQFEQLTAEERLMQRREKSAPILEAYWTWLNTISRPTGKLKDAITYAQNQKAHLCAFLAHGEIEISNNQVENAIRPFVVGRKGWLFADTPQGAEASAIIYSLMETAKANNLRLDDYLLHLLSILPERAEQSKDFEIEDLLPWSEEMKSWFSAV